MASEAAAGRARDQCRWRPAPSPPPSLVRPPILPRASGVTSVPYESTRQELQSRTKLHHPRSEEIGLQYKQELSKHPTILISIAETSTRNPRSHNHTTTPENHTPQDAA